MKEQRIIQIGVSRPAMLERRRVTTMRDLGQGGGESSQVQIGLCGGCGGQIGQSCSCDAAGMRGVAAIPWTRGLAMMRGMFGEGYESSEAGAKLGNNLAARFPGGVPEPHTDCSWDYTNMDTLYSNVTAIGAGLTVNVEVEPEAGCFFAFYWRVIVRDPTTGVASVDWAWSRPRVEGCPIACDDLARVIASQFAPVADPLDQRCCGMPIRAFLQRPSEELPLQVPIINQSAAALDAQVEVRGFCCSTRIC